MLALLIAPTLQAAPPTTAEQYIAGLRDRRFFRLATEFAEQQLADSALSDEQALGLTLELSRTHAAWALHQPPATREAHWQQADVVLANFRRTRPAHSHLALLELQQALNGLARGELLRQEAEVGAATAAAFESAKQTLRRVIADLEALEEKLAKAAGSTATWDADERLALHDHTRWQLARARKNQALCYPSGSADRVAALTAALEPLTGLLRELPPESALYWPARLESAECQRLLQDFSTAGRQVEAILAADAPPQIVLRARGELAQVHLARNDFEAMLSVLQQGRTIGDVTSPELDLVYLKCYLALWQRDSQTERPNDAAAWLAKAEQVAKLMEATHGAYWRRRADRMLASAARGSGAAAGNLDVLMRTADNLYVRKQYADAIAAYSDAARTAEGSGDSATALMLWKKAAAVHQLQGETSVAADVLAAATVRMWEAEGAAEAHLSAILLAARATGTDAQHLPLYMSLMAQHMERWPERATANQVRVWQGKLMEHRQNWAAAVRAYTGMHEATAAQQLAAATGAARAYQQLIAAAEDQAAQAQLAAEALQYFAAMTQQASRQADRIAVYQVAAMQLAKFELQYRSPVDYRRVEQTLTQVLKIEGASPTVRREARSPLIVALAAQPTRRAEALRQLRELGSSNPSELFSLLDQLSQLSDAFNEASRREIAVLILEVCETLLQPGNQLSVSQRDQIQQRQATALVSAGRRQEALGILSGLASRHARDASIQEAYAQLLVESEDRTSLTKALERWRWIGQRTRPETERWWRAKYNVALAHARLGDNEQASKVIRYALATGAGEPGKKLAKEMNDLLRSSSREQ